MWRTLVWIPVMAGCTASILPVSECTSNLECRDAFGLGSVCGAESGLCETAVIPDRCDASEPDDLAFPVDPDETFLIATLFGRTDAHIARYQAAELAVRQANISAAFSRDFAVIHCNYDDIGDGVDQAGAVTTIAEWLTEDVGIQAIVGPAASGLTAQAYSVASAEQGALIVSPSATSVDLTNIDGITSTDADPGLFWRTAPPDDAQAAAIAYDMRNTYDPLGESVYRRAPTDRVAIIYQEGPYGGGLATAVAQLMSDEGATSDFKPFSDPALIGGLIADVAQGNAQEILFISSNAEDYTQFLRGAAGIAWYDDKPIFLTDGGRTTDILESAVASLYPNIRGSVPALPEGPQFDAFNANYLGAFGASAADHSFVAHTYDAAWLVMYGHAWAEGQESGFEGIHLARGFRHVTAGTLVNIQLETANTVVSTLSGGGSVDLVGASGPLAYDLTSGELAGIVEIFTVNAQGTNFDAVDLYVP